MRLLIRARLPVEPFNTYTRQGKVGALMNRILEETKPEAVYFTEDQGEREALLVVEVDTPSGIPALTEPWFLYFNATCEIRIAMSPQDLGEAGLDELGRKWANPPD